MAAVARDILAYQCTTYDARAQLAREIRLNPFADGTIELLNNCLLYTSPSPRDRG